MASCSAAIATCSSSGSSVSCHTCVRPAAAEHHALTRGGEGCLELAEAVVSHATAVPASPRAPYAPDDSAQQKVHLLATKVYGAAGVAWDPSALRDLERFTDAGYLNVLTGAIATMPGLPAHPRLLDLDLSPDRAVIGLT